MQLQARSGQPPLIFRARSDAGIAAADLACSRTRVRSGIGARRTGRCQREFLCRAGEDASPVFPVATAGARARASSADAAHETGCSDERWRPRGGVSCRMSSGRSVVSSAWCGTGACGDLLFVCAGFIVCAAPVSCFYFCAEVPHCPPRGDSVQVLLRSCPARPSSVLCRLRLAAGI